MIQGEVFLGRLEAHKAKKKRMEGKNAPMRVVIGEIWKGNVPL